MCELEYKATSDTDNNSEIKLSPKSHVTYVRLGKLAFLSRQRFHTTIARGAPVTVAGREERTVMVLSVTIYTEHALWA